MRVASPIGGLCSGHTMRGAVLAAILGGAQVQAASLSEALSNATFYHTGTAHATDEYEYVTMKVSYNEQDNVTCTGCGWHVGGKWDYLWQKLHFPGPPSPPPSCKTKVVGHNLDVRGNDLGSHIIATGELCAAACCANPDCAGALFEPNSTLDFGSCKAGKPCCFMKTSVLGTMPWPVTPPSTLYETVGHSSGPPVDDVVPPPMGLRSSPALGGVGAGSTELRSDGSFRDWTILNQGPAGSGKYGIVDDVWMAARIGGKAKVLRTHPPAYAAGHGVSALTFSGSYPLTRLLVEDEALTSGGGGGGEDPTATAASDDDSTSGVEARVFGYSTLKPASLAESAYPALVLTLEVKNSGTEDTTADFMFTLPFGGWTDCSRKSAANGTATSKVSTYADCMHACADGCASWEYTDGTCTHNPDVPLTAHAVGSYCGVKGSGWALSQDKKAMTWTQKPEAVGPSMGTITLRPSVSTSTTASASAADDDATGGAASVSFGAADDPAKLFEEFSSDGKFSAGNAASGAVAASGAASASATVPAGETVTLSIVFAWYFPDRDYKANSDKTTDGIILGNMYQNLWSGSEEVAAALASEERLASIVGDINAHHQVVAHVDNPTPVWLKDMLLNQFSHYHMFMWYKDGRMREYEAWSCDDVDSVHNDYQRHLLYIWAFPEFETQKMEAWGSWAQDPKDGHVFECLAGFGHGPLDKPTGRYMGDTSAIFVLEAYEYYMHTGNKTFVTSMWPGVKRAIDWCMTNANAPAPNTTAPYGLPQKVTTTYDHFGFEKHQAVTYNAHIYLTALNAAKVLAATAGDTASLATIDKSYTLAQSAIVDPARLWNETEKFFRCHTKDGGEGDNQIFTDSLYGQMLSHHHFGGNFTLDKTFLESHLKYEWEMNQDTYGMRVLNDPIQEDSIWMNGPPTWTYLSLALGAEAAAEQEQEGSLLLQEEGGEHGALPWDDEAAWEPLKRMSENFRVRLRDMWNLRALTHTDGSVEPAETTREIERGAPREQGHYGFMLTDLFLLPLLSGQVPDLPHGKLALAPKYPAPYGPMPVLLAGLEASIASEAKGKYTLKVAFGSLKLPAGGLSADGVVCEKAVDLQAGEEISWP